MTRTAWKNLPRPTRRWIVVNTVVVSAVINAVLNTAIAWFGTRGHDSVQLWVLAPRQPSIIADTVSTLFMLPFMTSLMCTSGVRRELRAGSIPPLASAGRPAWLPGLPQPLLRRAVQTGLVAMVVLGPPAVLALVVFGGEVGVPPFIAFKATFAVALGLVVTPLIAMTAMADPFPTATPRRPAAAPGGVPA